MSFGFNRLFRAKQLLLVDSQVLGLSPPPLLSDTSPGVWNGCMTSWDMGRERVLDLLSQGLWHPWFLKQFSFFVFLITGNLVGHCPWSLHATKCWSNLLVQLWLSSTSTKNCLIWAPVGYKDLSWVSPMSLNHPGTRWNTVPLKPEILPCLHVYPWQGREMNRDAATHLLNPSKSKFLALPLTPPSSLTQGIFFK